MILLRNFINSYLLFLIVDLINREGMLWVNLLNPKNYFGL